MAVCPYNDDAIQNMPSTPTEIKMTRPSRPEIKNPPH